MSPKKSIAIGAGIAGSAGLGLLAFRRQPPEPVARTRSVHHRAPAPRKPAQPRPVTAKPEPESHAMRNAAIAGVGIAGAGALYAKWRLGPTVRGGVWRKMGALTPGMIAFARTPTELLKTRRVPWMMKKTGHGNEIAILPVRRTAFAPTMDKARKEALTGHADAGSLIDAVRDARAQVAANVKRDRQHRLTLYAALAPGMIRFGKLSTLNLQRSTFLDRPRTEAGTFAGGDTAGNPADMTAAYGHPQTRVAAITSLLAGGTLAGAALRLRKKQRLKP